MILGWFEVEAHLTKLHIFDFGQLSRNPQTKCCSFSLMPPLLSLKIPNDEPLPQPFLFRSTVTLMNSNLHLNSHFRKRLLLRFLFNSQRAWETLRLPCKSSRLTTSSSVIHVPSWRFTTSPVKEPFACNSQVTSPSKIWLYHVSNSSDSNLLSYFITSTLTTYYFGVPAE